MKPEIEKAIAKKEAELETLLDGFSGLSPKLKERANQRGEAIQKEIDRLQRDLVDLRVPREWLQTNLKARQEALERATAILNQESRFRQKAEALKTVVDRIVCHFSRSGKRCTLKSIDIHAAEDGAIQPLSFPESDSLQMNRRLGVLAREKPIRIARAKTPRRRGSGAGISIGAWRDGRLRHCGCPTMLPRDSIRVGYRPGEKG
ncbi:MAG: hypothetical protein JW809_09265 [Pirellulales bacterium]|nr:hypothetical protein [Pirellulales bacterium]